MKNKGVNFLYVSALDVLIGTLGIFIILNFLNARLAGQPVPPPPPVAAVKPTPTTAAPAKPAPTPTASWWRRMWTNTEPKPPVTQTGQPGRRDTVDTRPVQEERLPPMPPQDPVAVDLLKQTRGAVVLLLQQADQSKASVEVMLRQGSRVWKAGRASKYQDEIFKYQKGMNYFFQPTIQPGAYEVMVRVRRGSRGGASQPFTVFGKIIPAGQRARTYNFGTYAVNGSQSDWVSAGSFVVNGSGLSFRPQLPKASEIKPPAEGNEPAPSTSPIATPPAEAPVPPPAPAKKRAGKWG